MAQTKTEVYEVRTIVKDRMIDAKDTAWNYLKRGFMVEVSSEGDKDWQVKVYSTERDDAGG